MECGSARYQSLLAALPDDDACAVCFGVRCQPARMSDQCEHTFCRLCVLKCKGSTAGSAMPCPLCRAPIAESLETVLLPSEIAYNQAAAAALASAHPLLYRSALHKEEEEEARLRETLIPNVRRHLAPPHAAPLRRPHRMCMLVLTPMTSC